MQPPISDAALFLKMLVRCPTVLQADVSLPLNVRSEIEVERDVDLINGKQQPFYFEKENLPYEMMNCTPFVRQYGILFRKWGVFVCQRDNESTTERRR